MGDITQKMEDGLNKLLGRTGDKAIDIPDWLGPVATTLIGAFAGKAAGSAVGGGAGGGIGAILGGVLGGAAGSGGLDGLLDKFKGAGAEQQVASWVSTGENQPVDPATVEQALGTETIDQIAAETGHSRQEVEEGLAKVIPGVVNAVTPNGELPDQASLQALGDKIGGPRA